MAKLVLKDASITIGGNDLSSAVRQIELSTSADLADAETMGDDWHEKLPGLKDWSVSLTFAQDFAASQVDAILFPLLGTSTAVVIKPTSAAVSSGNPSFTGNAIMTSYSPMGAGVGDLAEAPVELQGNGALTRATS